MAVCEQPPRFPWLSADAFQVQAKYKVGQTVVFSFEGKELEGEILKVVVPSTTTAANAATVAVTAEPLTYEVATKAPRQGYRVRADLVLREVSAAAAAKPAVASASASASAVPPLKIAPSCVHLWRTLLSETHDTVAHVLVEYRERLQAGLGYFDPPRFFFSCSCSSSSFFSFFFF